MQIVWSPQLLRDLRAIRDYIAIDSERYADLTIARIFSAVERLLDFPESGRIVPERNDPEIREMIVGRFRVVYRFLWRSDRSSYRFSGFSRIPRKILTRLSGKFDVSSAVQNRDISMRASP
jgi:toxin ParE1/3/4